MKSATPELPVSQAVPMPAVLQKQGSWASGLPSVQEEAATGRPQS